jgi:hypothetical protein
LHHCNTVLQFRSLSVYRSLEAFLPVEIVSLKAPIELIIYLKANVAPMTVKVRSFVWDSRKLLKCVILVYHFQALILSHIYGRSHFWHQNVMCPGVSWLIITGSELDDWIYWHLHLHSLLITVNYNSSQPMAAQDSLHPSLDYECLLFYCYWLDSHLRIGHVFSFCCLLVITPRLNTQHNYWTLNSLMNWMHSYMSPFYNFVEDQKQVTTSNYSSVILCLFVAAGTFLVTHYLVTDLLPLLRA